MLDGINNYNFLKAVRNHTMGLFCLAKKSFPLLKYFLAAKTQS